MKKIILIISIFFIGLNYAYAKETVTFSRCMDGDTFKAILHDKEVTIRMLAIDTPESVKPDTIPEYYGKEASEYTCNRLTNAKKIELEYDPKSDKKDKYDRVLAWVFVDNKLLEEELVSQGYAEVAYLYSDYKYSNELKIKQELASAKGLGIWNTEEKTKFEKSSGTSSTTEDSSPKEDEDITNIEVIIIVGLFLLITLIGKLTMKKK